MVIQKPREAASLIPLATSWASLPASSDPGVYVAAFAPVISYVPIPRKIYTVGPLTRKDRVARAPPRSGTTPPSEQTKLEQFISNCVLKTVYRIIMPHACHTLSLSLPQFSGSRKKTHVGRHAPHPPTRRRHRLST